MPVATIPQCYCRGCGYSLAGLEANRCPECGRTFDPADRRTFDLNSDRHSTRRKLRRLVILLIGLECIVVLPLSVLQWQRQAEERAVAYVTGRGGVVLRTPIGPHWLQTFLGSRAYLLDRVDTVDFRLSTATPDTPLDLKRLYPLTQLRFLRLGYDMRTQDVAALTGFNRLEWLDISSCHIDDDALRQIAAIRHLRRLELGSDLVGGGLVYLRAATSLKSIQFNTALGLWLRALRSVPNLDELQFSGRWVPRGGPVNRLSPQALWDLLDAATVPDFLDNSGAPSPSISPLLEKLSGEADPAKRVELIRQLGRARDERAVDLLARIAGDASENAAVRADCIWALGDIGGPSACTALVNLLSSDFTHLNHPRQQVDASEYQTYVIQSLSRASGMQFGNDVQAWRQWAALLPPSDQPIRR